MAYSPIRAASKRAEVDAIQARRRLAPAERQMRFSVWAAWWLDQTALVDRPATAARDRSILRAHLLSSFGEMSLRDVTMPRPSGRRETPAATDHPTGVRQEQIEP